MIKETIIKFTDEDFELLSRPIPSDPCKDCRDRFGCCGCPSGTAYGNIIKPYKDAGILEYANTIRKIRDANELIKKTKREMNALIDTLPDEIVRNKNIKFKEWEINHEQK